MSTAATPVPFPGRLDAVRVSLQARGLDALCVSLGPDLPWLTGYEAMPLERLTMLVVPRDAEAVLIVPRIEAPRVVERPEVFRLHPWEEGGDPIGIVADLLGSATAVALGDRTWAGFLIDLQRHLPQVSWRRASEVTGPLRARKDPHELAMLARVSAAADAVVGSFVAGDIPLIGRTESEVAAELGRRLIEVGHHRVNFTIVAAGANAASPHHEPGERVIGPNEVVLADIGGTMLDPFGVGYCSDITRCVWTGTPSPRAAEAWRVLQDAQGAAVAAATVGITGAELDALCRSRLERHGWGGYFIHRTGHGIGVEEHEDPYIVVGNDTPLEAGHVFSIEPGVYLPGEFGFRLEDIVTPTAEGGRSFNHVIRSLQEVTR